LPPTKINWRVYHALVKLLDLDEKKPLEPNPNDPSFTVVDTTEEYAPSASERRPRSNIKDITKEFMGRSIIITGPKFPEK
jgi:hypothetical protein